MTSTSSQRIQWPVVLLAMVGLIVAAPFIFAFLVVALALTVGLMGKLLKLGLVAFGVYAAVMLFKGLFGSKRPAAMPIPPRTLTRVPTVPRYDHEAEMEREKRDSLAALDKELARALAKQDPRSL